MRNEFFVNGLSEAVCQLSERLTKIEGLLIEQTKTAPQNNPSELLTTEQAAELLFLAVPTLYSKVCKGEIASIKSGRRLLFYKRDLICYLEARRRRSNTEIKEDAINRIGTRKGVSHE